MPVAQSCLFCHATGGQWQRAVDLYDTIRGKGTDPEAATTNAVLSALATSQQVDKSIELLQVSAPRGCRHYRGRVGLFISDDIAVYWQNLQFAVPSSYLPCHQLGL